MDTDEKKRDRFNHGLTCAMQKQLFNGRYQTFGELMRATIGMEGLPHDTDTEGKRQRMIVGSSSHPHPQKVQVVRKVPYQSSGFSPFARHSRLTTHRLFSFVHLPNRCSSLRDNMLHLVRTLRTALVHASSVVRRATMLVSAHKTSQLSPLNLQLIHV
jgi:hypothetical protein